MADIVSEIIGDIQYDIDGGYYDPGTFDLYEAIWETLDNKLIYTHEIIKYWESIPGYASDEITRLMTEEITEHVSGSISESDFSLPGDFTANRRAFRKRAYSGGEMGWENTADGGDPIYSTTGHGPDGRYGFSLYTNDVNIVFEAEGEEGFDYDDIWTFEHGGNIPSGDRLIALGDTMAIEFEETGNVSNPIGRVSRRAMSARPANRRAMRVARAHRRATNRAVTRRRYRQ